ncbi:MAG: type II toxin-antitoxin system VapC family toxin [Sulfuritalea sp.]|nr:type II toxin-antitoxin system VapC family toxin [Sulfuritalea sp.]
MSSRPPLVIDCSAAIPWFLDDEASAWSESLLDALPSYSLHVPSLWHLEFANVLLTAQRRKRVAAKDARGLLARASRLPLVTDGRVVPLVEIAELAESHGITTYDAAYLELAMRLKCPLATQDKALAKAAKRLGSLYA